MRDTFTVELIGESMHLSVSLRQKEPNNLVEYLASGPYRAKIAFQSLSASYFSRDSLESDYGSARSV